MIMPVMMDRRRVTARLGSGIESPPAAASGLRRRRRPGPRPAPPNLESESDWEPACHTDGESRHGPDGGEAAPGNRAAFKSITVARAPGRDWHSDSDHDHDIHAAPTGRVRRRCQSRADSDLGGELSSCGPRRPGRPGLAAAGTDLRVPHRRRTVTVTRMIVLA